MHGINDSPTNGEVAEESPRPAKTALSLGGIVLGKTPLRELTRQAHTSPL